MLTFDTSTWRLSAAACIASMEVGAAAPDGDASLLLQACSTGVIATSKNSFASLRGSILPKMLIYRRWSQGLSTACCCFWALQPHYKRSRKPLLPSCTCCGRRCSAPGTSLGLERRKVRAPASQFMLCWWYLFDVILRAVIGSIHVELRARTRQTCGPSMLVHR